MNLYGFGKAVTYLYVRLAFRLRYEGLENIPDDQGFIICCNHRSFHDPLFIAHKVKKPLFFMAKSEFYKNKLIAWLFRSLNAFPVQRGSGDMTAINHARDLIKNGSILAMFPEGSRSRDGKPRRAKPGVAMIAGMVGCGVLPVGISYKGNLRFRRRVTVRYGKLLTAEELGIDAKASSTVRRAAGKVMEAIVAEMDRDCYGTRPASG